MTHHPLLQILLVLALMTGLYKTKEFGQVINEPANATVTIPAPAHAPTPMQPAAAENRQAGSNDFLWVLSGIGDDNSSDHHKDGELHYINFDRIRRKPSGFSIRCACVRLLLAIVYFGILMLMLCHFLHVCLS